MLPWSTRGRARDAPVQFAALPRIPHDLLGRRQQGRYRTSPTKPKERPEEALVGQELTSSCPIVAVAKILGLEGNSCPSGPGLTKKAPSTSGQGFCSGSSSLSRLSWTDSTSWPDTQPKTRNLAKRPDFQTVVVLTNRRDDPRHRIEYGEEAYRRLPAYREALTGHGGSEPIYAVGKVFAACCQAAESALGALGSNVFASVLADASRVLSEMDIDFDEA